MNMNQKPNSDRHPHTQGVNKNGNAVRRSPQAKQPETTGELRPVFAAYLNMARMNLYNTLRYISNLCDITDKTTEDKLFDMKLVTGSKLTSDKQEKACALLMERLPVLRSMSQVYATNESPNVPNEKVLETLQRIIHIIHFQRNLHTHADHYDTPEEKAEEKKNEKALLDSLDCAFMSAKRTVKNTFQYTDNDMKFIDGNERMERKEKVIKGKKVRFYAERSDYYFRLGTPEWDGLSTAGLTFLICKLLSKKYATIFLQRIGLFKSMRQNGGYSPFTVRENEVMFNIFCSDRIRLPKGRLVSTTDQMALGLDMLNELQKCPTELFETFCKADRSLFEVRHNSMDDDAENTTSNNADEDINLMRRKGDRFTQLALQYLSNYTKPSIVFQLSLGKYRYKFYDRAPFHQGEKDHVRVLQKEINGFGPLAKAEELRKTKYENILRKVNSDDSDRLYDADTAQTRPYLTDQYARFAVTNNRIGIMWNDQFCRILDKDNSCYLPNLPEPSATGNPAEPWAVDKDKIEHNAVPRAWLSTFDLPAFLFLHLLGGKPSNVIREAYGNMTRLFDEIKNNSRNTYFNDPLPNGDSARKVEIEKRKMQLEPLLYNDYHLHISQVPDKVVEYLIGCGIGDSLAVKQDADDRFNKWADKRVTELRDETKRRFERIEKDLDIVGTRDNRIGRKGYVEIRPGALARYLAKDIVAMTKSLDGKGKDKISGLDFNVLQSEIAVFYDDGDKPLKETSLGATLRQVVGTNRHPFIKTVMDKNVYDTIDLYQEYLIAKAGYFNDLLRSRNYTDAWFLREAYRNHAAKTDEYMQGDKGLAARYPDTLQLPDGLFTDAIRDQLGINDETRNNPHIQAALADEKYGHSAAYLLNVYFTHVLGDDSQPFYRSQGDRYKRHYKLFDTLWSKDTYMTDDEISYRLRKEGDNPALIRRAIDKYKNQTEEYTKLMHQLRDMQRNERDIRRYRNEDMLLFLIAKKLLFAFKGTDFDQFHLQDIVPIGDKQSKADNILNQTIPFSVRIDLLDDENKPIKDENKQPMQRTIRQEGLKLKNYGDFQKFLYDSRIGLLLSQLDEPEGGFPREDLERELERYDNSRPEIFRVLQEIERDIIHEHQSALCDENYGKEGFGYTDDKGDYMSYRNNFSRLLTLCDQYRKADGMPNEQAEIFTEIRNSYSHNRYVKELCKLIEAGDLSLPNVAELIHKKLIEMEKRE